MSRINLENSDSTAQSVSDRLLTLLKTRGPQQASDAGKVLGTTGEAARQQFVKLAKEGLVEAVAETRGVGRPVQLWHLTSAGNARFPDTHADLTVQLLRTVRDKLGEQALDVLIETREQENRINYKQAMIGAADLRERVARLTGSAAAKAIWPNGVRKRTVPICWWKITARSAPPPPSAVASAGRS